MKKFSIIFLLIGLFIPCFAQKTFKYESAINKISQDGFYKIYLSPEVIARSMADLSDLRIVSSKGKFLPYAIETELPADYENFIAFPTLEAVEEKDSTSVVVIQNVSDRPINTLWVNLKNAAVQRTADLLGSDDRVSWYAIKESISLIEASETKLDHYSQSLSFPTTTYKYLKIKIDNKKKNPLKIIQVGIYQNKIRPAKFDRLPNPVIIWKDSTNNTSYLKLKFGLNYQLDKLHFQITAPKYYDRAVSIFEIVNGQKTFIKEAKLTSGSGNELYFSAKTNEIQFEIQNDDNPPLTINGIRAYQQSEFIISYLEKGDAYRLLFDDFSAKLPSYDLASFTQKNKIELPELTHSIVSKNPDFELRKVNTKPDYKLLMWIGLAIAGLVLLFLTFRMLNEINVKRSE